MLMSLCEFSITLAASATLIVGAKCVPAVIILLYNASTFSPISGVEPEVTFKIFSTVCSLSPGLIRSGEYPAKKSTLNFNPDTRSSTGIHSSSVAPGNTVDSYTTTSPFFNTLPTVSDALYRGVKSGLLCLSTGVGTVII